MADKVILRDKLDLVDEHWCPRTVGKLNGQVVKIAKIRGEFIWHRHEFEDELFLVVKGQMAIKLRHGEVTLEAGEFFIVPRGAEHKPVADEEAHILLFEPEGTVNTGDVRHHLTVDTPQQI